MADRPVRPAADPDWAELHAVAAQEQSAFAQLLLAAFASLAGRTILLRLRSALRYGQIDAALQAVRVADLLTLQPAVEAVLGRVARDGATIGQASIVLQLGTQTLPTADLAYWARTRAASLVVGISQQTRQAIRGIIVTAIERGISPAKAADLIESVVGLNTVQAGAVLRRYDELVEAGVTVARRQAILARYGAQLRRQRARVIARHELLQAANAGRRLQWERNVRDGLIAPDRWEREWVAIVPSDGRTCPYCEGQDGQRAPITGAYPDGSAGPPGHVVCRCTEVLVRAA